MFMMLKHINNLNVSFHTIREAGAVVNTLKHIILITNYLLDILEFTCPFIF